MTRTFTHVDLVQLPRIDSHGAVALATAIEAAANQFNDLSQALLDTLAQVKSDRQTLLQALAKTPAGVLTIKEADRRVDKLAGAFHDLAAVWATIAEFLPEGEAGKLILSRCFADGRRFINFKVKEEWAAIETKLATIDREGLAPQVQAIGAMPLLTLLRQFHADYGVAIGTTQPLEEAPEVRESKDALLDSIRSYVIQVAATVKRGKPETTIRADALLKPLHDWESTRAAKQSPEPAVPPVSDGSSMGASSSGNTGG
jgi:hypothetical protein